jgi:Zn finger protein HypA/HybF involved in hydrogenase expression
MGIKKPQESGVQKAGRKPRIESHMKVELTCEACYDDDTNTRQPMILDSVVDRDEAAYKCPKCNRSVLLSVTFVI